jgi:hypothetical protein
MFVITEDVALPMVLADRFTIVGAIVLGAEIVMGCVAIGEPDSAANYKAEEANFLPVSNS